MCAFVCTEVNKVFVMVPSVLLDEFQDDHSIKKKNAPLKSECLVVTSGTNLRWQTYSIFKTVKSVNDCAVHCQRGNLLS